MSSPEQTPCLAVVGPTATGKTAVALEVARRLGPGTEIVSVDAMQVYRGMDVGTAKATPAERAEVPHHLVDVVDPDEEYTVACFARDVAGVRRDAATRSARLVLAGGTGLYLRAALGDLDVPGRYPEVRRELEAEPDTVALHRRLAGLDAVAASRIEPTNRRRVIRALEVTLGSGRPFSAHGPGLTAYPPTPVVLVGLRLPRPVLDQRIAARLGAQLDAGLFDEVRALAGRPAGLSRTARQALGYKELLDHLEGRCGWDEAVELIAVRTRQFARRQERWFRRDPRISWIDLPVEDAGPAVVAEQVLARLAEGAGTADAADPARATDPAGAAGAS